MLNTSYLVDVVDIVYLFLCHWLDNQISPLKLVCNITLSLFFFYSWQPWTSSCNFLCKAFQKWFAISSFLRALREWMDQGYPTDFVPKAGLALSASWFIALCLTIIPNGLLKLLRLYILWFKMCITVEGIILMDFWPVTFLCKNAGIPDFWKCDVLIL